MASGGKRGAGERVLEGRHVIGLFLLMLLFSGVFFTLGYLMGRDSFSSQVRAASPPSGSGSDPLIPKPAFLSKHAQKSSPAAAPAPAEPAASPATTDPGWEFYDAAKSKPADERLKPSAPAPSAKALPAASKSTASPKNAVSSKTGNAPMMPAGSYFLQVAALTKQADALDLASRLRKRSFPSFVLSPQSDKYYRVQVGPYTDQKSADAAKKGLEVAGFKAIVKH
jgi:septal ring-binding cell division protein DamX